MLNLICQQTFRLIVKDDTSLALTIRIIRRMIGITHSGKDGPGPDSGVVMEFVK